MSCFIFPWKLRTVSLIFIWQISLHSAKAWKCIWSLEQGIDEVSIYCMYGTTNELQRHKRTVRHVRPAKIQISAHSRSLFRIFTGHILDIKGCKVSPWGQRRLWSDCADAQVDLNLRCSHVRRDVFWRRGSNFLTLVQLAAFKMVFIKKALRDLWLS